MLKIGVLGNEGSWYVQDLQRAACKRGYELTRLDYREMLNFNGTDGSLRLESLSKSSSRADLTRFDAIIVRTMPPGSLEQVVFRMDGLLSLQQRGVIILNSARAIECAVDKYLTTARLEQCHLPVPLTCTCETTELAMYAFERLGGDVVIKPLFGAEGRGIVRVSDPDLAFRTFRTIERTQAVIYLQEFIPHEGFDIRVLVLGGKITGAIRRENPHDFRTNMARNGQAKQHQPTELEMKLAQEAAAAIGASFAGVDLLYHSGGECFVIEVNAVPGWRAFQKTTDMDVAGAVMDYLHSQKAGFPPQNETYPNRND